MRSIVYTKAGMTITTTHAPSVKRVTAMTRHTTAHITVPSAFMTALCFHPAGRVFVQRTNMPA